MKGFTDEERAAMKARVEDTEGESAVLSKINQMPEPDRSLAKKIHEIIRKVAPVLVPKTWYGMPAYAGKDGKVVCFFQGSHKFKYRYSTLGFQDSAHLDEDDMWAVAFAVTKLTPAVETKIIALLKKAAS